MSSRFSHACAHCVDYPAGGASYADVTDVRGLVDVRYTTGSAPQRQINGVIYKYHNDFVKNKLTDGFEKPTYFLSLRTTTV